MARGSYITRRAGSWQVSSAGPQRAGDAVAAPGQRDASVGHSGDGWQTALHSAATDSQLTPFAEQLLVHGSQTSVQAQCSQKWFVLGPMASLFPCLELPSWGKGTGHTCGQAAGQHLQGCQVLGSLGAEAFHNPIPLHAIKKKLL